MPIDVDILGQSCDVVKHGNLLKIASIHFPFECIYFQRLSHIFASHTRQNLEAREAEVSTLPWTQTENDTVLDRCRGGQHAWRKKKHVLSLSAVTDDEGHPLENEDESGRRLCEYWRTIFQARVEGPRHLQLDDILRYVQQAPDDISWTIDQAEFDDVLALKKDSALGPDGIPYGAYRCAGGGGGLISKFLFNFFRALLEGGAVPDCFAESRTVFIPKTSHIDDNGRIIRSPDALRPLTLCNCDCKLLPSVVAFTGTLCNAFILHRDASPLRESWQTGKTTGVSF